VDRQPLKVSISLDLNTTVELQQSPAMVWSLVVKEAWDLVDTPTEVDVGWEEHTLTFHLVAQPLDLSNQQAFRLGCVVVLGDLLA